MRTEEQKVTSSSALSSFVEDYKLRDKNSLINFHANVRLQTPKDNIQIRSSIRIYFDGFDEYGTLIINDEQDQLEVEKYPTEFKAKFSDFVQIKSGIQIVGNHPSIGSYTVEVFPLGI